MARLGRGQPGYRSGHSRLRPPTVVGEAVQAAPFYGPGVKLVPVEDQRGHSRRAPKSVLNPPATLEAAPAVVYPGPQTYLTEPHRPAVTRSALQVPSAVEAAAVVISQGPRVKLVPAEDQRGHSRRAPKSVLQPPAPLEEVVVAAVYPGPRVELAKTSPQADPRRKTEYDVAAPIVVTPNDALGWIGIQLADSRNARSDGRRAPHSELRPPTTLAAAAPAFVSDPVRVARAEPRRQPATRPELRAPAVVDPAVTYRPTDINLAEPRRPAATRTELRPPTVLAVVEVVVYRPLDVHLAEPHRPAATRPELRAPAVVDPAVTYRPVDVRLAEPHRPAPTHSKLQAPAVVGPAATYALEVSLTEPHRPAATRPELRAPAVVDPAVVYRPVDVHLTEPHRPAGVRSRLQPPSVVGPGEGVVYEPVDVRLERARHVRPAGHTELAAPSVVGPAAIYRPVSIALAEARKPVLGRWDLRAPTVLAPPLGTPVETTLDIHLAPSGDPRRRFAKPELRAPAVVDPAVVYRPPATHLAAHPRQARAPHSELKAPQVVREFVADAVRVSLVPAPPRRLRQSDVRPPRVLAPVETTLRVNTVLSSRDVPRRLAKSELRVPRVLAPAVVYPPVSTTFAPHPRQGRAPSPFYTDFVVPPEDPTAERFFDPFDRPAPRGPDPVTADSDDYGRATPGGPDHPTPGAERFDRP